MLENSFKNVIRGWKKSLLFWLLIVLIALFFISGLVLAVGMEQYSDETYAAYRTIGLFEYVGDAYPDESVYSENIEIAAKRLSALHLENDPRVETWDVPVKTIGYNAAIKRNDPEIPYYENAVLLVKTGTSKGDPWYTYVTVERALYSVRNTEGKRIKLDTYTIPLEPNHYYLVTGYYQVEGTPLPVLCMHSYRNAAAEKAGFDGNIENMVLDVTSPDGSYSIPEGNPLLSIAETYRVLNDGLNMTFTADVESLLPFEQEKLYLKSGRFFAAEEYAQGAEVCIVTEWVAGRLGVGVGDTIPLSVVYDPESASAESYWYETGFDAEKTYTVIGITNANEENLHCVFAPKAADTPQRGSFSYTLGVARLDNDGAEAFYADITPKLPENVRLLIYDQGWSTVSVPLKSVRKTIAWLSILSGAAMVVLAVVFGFLFVYSDRRTAQIMTKLGTNTEKVYGHYLVGAGLIAISAAAVSVILAAVCLPRIITAMDRTLLSTVEDHSLDFSNAALSFARPLEPLKAPGTGLLLLAGVIAVLLSLISCAFFTHAAMKKPMQRRETVSHRSHRGASRSLSGGALRYAALSAVRGGARSVASLVVILLCTVMLLGLAAAKRSYADQLAEIRNNTKIQGVYTDLSGRRTDGLLIDAHLINALHRTGMVEKVSVSAKQIALYVGRIITNGDKEEIETSNLGRTPQDLEKFADLLTADRLIFTDDMLRHPIFGSGTPVVRWLEGYDAAVFRETEAETVTRMVPQASTASRLPKDEATDSEPVLKEQTEVVIPAVVPERFLEDRSLTLGDIVQFQQQFSAYDVRFPKLRIVGSYHGVSKINRLFCPLIYYVSPELLYSEDANTTESLYPYTFENAQFTLKNSDDLMTLKQFFLDSGYSEVSKIRKYRTFVVLNDSSFLYTTAQLEKRIATLPSFYPLSIGVGIAIAFIIVFLRRKEVITMKLLGTKRIRAWLCLWLEQLLLCLVGVGLALLGFLLYKREVQPEAFRWLLLLCAGYLLSAALSAALLCCSKLTSHTKEV